MPDMPAPDRPRDLVLFGVMACALSWLDWGLIIASDRGWVPFRFGPNWWGSFGPALAALLVTARRGGVPRLRALLRSGVAWRFARRHWLVALLGPPALVALSAALFVASGGALRDAPPVDVAELVVLSVAILFIGGPLGEEVGWRGYLLRQLLPRMHAIAASLVVAGVWAIWHLPLIWMPGAVQAGGSFLLFSGYVAAFSILTTWLFIASGGSLLAAIVFHWAINVATYVGPMIQPALEERRFELIFLAVVWVAALGAIKAMTRSPTPLAREGVQARSGR